MSLNKTMNGFILFSIGMLVNFTTLAETVEPDQLAFSPDSLFFSDVPVVLSATRLSQPLKKTPGPVSVIDRKMIDASGAVNIADLMRLVPGFQATHSLGHRHSVTSHGLSSDWSKRLLVMIDGRSVYTSLLSTTDWTTLPIEMDDIERIEVFRGPNAPAYGANAFIGVINIITRRSFQDAGFYTKAIAGDTDHKYGMLRYAEAEGKYSQRFSMSYREDSGFPVLENFAGGYDDAAISKYAYRSEYNLSSKDIIEFQLGYSNGELQVGYENDIIDPIRDTGITTSHQLVAWERTLSATDSLKLQFHHNYTNKTDGYFVGPLSLLFGVPPSAIPGLTGGQPDQSIYFSTFDAKSERYDLELQNTTQLAKDLRMVWGGNLRLDQMSSFRWTGTNDTFEDFSQRLFSNVEWSLTDSTQINAGIMLEQHEDSDLRTSWRLAANHQLTEQQTVRASATHGVRELSLLEKNTFLAAYYNDGSPYDILTLSSNKEPELNDTFEIGYLFQSPSNNLSTDISLFKTKLTSLNQNYHDQFYIDPYELIDDREYNNSNDSRANIKGAELQLRWTPTSADLVSLQYGYAKINGSYLRAVNPDNYVYLNDEVPAHTVSLLASHTFDNDWAISGVYYYMSEMEWLGAGEPMPSYDRIDLRLAKEFKLYTNDAKAELVIQNLGSSYHEFTTVQNVADSEVNVFETRAYLKFGVQF